MSSASSVIGQSLEKLGVALFPEKTEKAGCTLNRKGFIAVDENLAANKNIFAIGDCNGKTLLAHAATRQGLYVANRILGAASSPYRPDPIPACVFGCMKIMRAGISEWVAAAVFTDDVYVSTSQLVTNPIAQAHADTAGFVKAVWHGGALVGMAAIGGRGDKPCDGSGIACGRWV